MIGRLRFQITHFCVPVCLFLSANESGFVFLICDIKVIKYIPELLK